ncbi:MAG: glycosyltransferase, partial [Myxococcales bacterium]|nr:glycosyltransferase [Myxococcales bacterium]
MATCYIASLKHAPGSYKEFRLMAEKLRAHGHDVRLLLTSEYRGMHESDLPTEYVVERTASAKDQLSDFARLSVPLLRGAHVEFFRDSPPDMLCCYNFHPLNLPLLLAARRARRQSLRFLFLHEPFYEFKREVYGAKQAGLLWLMEMGLRSMIFASNRVVVPSMNAARLLRRLLPILPLPVHVQSLVAPDHNPLLDRERSHVAFVGKMDNAKGKLDLFGQILERAASRRVDLRFAVLTAADLTGYLSALSPEARALVDFSHGSPVSDEQIVEMLSRSMATLLLHTHLSESGVVPMS